MWILPYLGPSRLLNVSQKSDAFLRDERNGYNKGIARVQSLWDIMGILYPAEESPFLTANKQLLLSNRKSFWVLKNLKVCNTDLGHFESLLPPLP